MSGFFSFRRNAMCVKKQHKKRRPVGNAMSKINSISQIYQEDFLNI